MINADLVFETLQRCADSDSSVIAEFRRSLSFDPGTYAPVFPWLEPHVGHAANRARERAYLVTGLWALASKRGSGDPCSLPDAMRRVARSRESRSVEARFVALLDSEGDELIWRLRHVIDLIAAEKVTLNWPALLRDVLAWDADSRFIQQRWAREYWRSEASLETPSAELAAPISPQA
ncbi:MAG: type I-E CRISPR-associated protein Cse2/CasB [Burkholderiaceae bacterium]